MKMKSKMLLVSIFALLLTGCNVSASGKSNNGSQEQEERILKMGDINIANNNSELAFDFDEVLGAKEYHFKLIDNFGEVWKENEKYTPKTTIDISQLPPGNYLPYLKAIGDNGYKDSDWISSKISFNILRVEIGTFTFLYDSKEMVFSPFLITENEGAKTLKMRFSWSQGGEYKNKDFDITDGQELDLSSFKTNTQYTLSAKVETENVMRSMPDFEEVGGLFIPELEKEETPKDFSYFSNGTIHYRDEGGLKKAQLTFFDLNGNESYVKMIQNDETLDLTGVRDFRYYLGLKFLGNGKGIADSDFAFLDNMIKVGNVGLEERDFEINQIVDSQSSVKIYFNFNGTISYQVDIYKKDENKKVFSSQGSEQVFEFETPKEMGTDEYEAVVYVAADSIYAQKTVKKTFNHKAALVRAKKEVKRYLQLVEAVGTRYNMDWDQNNCMNGYETIGIGNGSHDFYKENLGTVWYTDYDSIQESDIDVKGSRGGFDIKQVFTLDSRLLIQNGSELISMKKRTLYKDGKNGKEIDFENNKYYFLNNYSKEKLHTKDDYPISSFSENARYSFDYFYDNFAVFDSTRLYCAFWVGIFITDYKASDTFTCIETQPVSFETTDKIGITIEETGEKITKDMIFITKCGIKYNTAVGNSFEALFNGYDFMKIDESYIYAKSSGTKSLHLKEITVTTTEAI